MKTKRRQELKTNDLAAWLNDLGQSFSQWGTYVIVVLAVILIAVVIKGYMSNARQEARTVAFTDLRNASSARIGESDKSVEELRTSFNTIDDLVQNSNDPEFRIEALLSKASLGLQLGQRELIGTPGQPATDQANAKEYLDAARSAFEQIAAEFKDAPLNYGRAVYGLFQVEALEFVMDGDPSHRGHAEKHLEKLRDDTRFSGTPLQTVAIDRLNDLDNIFTTVTFAARPAPSPKPSTMVPLGPTLPPGVDLKIEPKDDEAAEVQDAGSEDAMDESMDGSDEDASSEDDSSPDEDADDPE